MSRYLSVFLITGFSLLATWGTVRAESWSHLQNPANFLFPDERLETRFDFLQMSASVSGGVGHLPASDSYWPSYLGGIANRFFDRSGNAFRDAHPTLAQLRKMTSLQIRALSATEKFDVSQADYNYTFTKRVLNSVSPDASGWKGLCNGWASASVNYPEPEAVVTVNKDGISVEFGSSDIKALLAFYQAYVVGAWNEFDEQNWGYDQNGKIWQKDAEIQYAEYRAMGSLCDNVAQGSAPVRAGILGSLFGRNKVDLNVDCKGDLNPGTLHLILANLVGRSQRSFVVDVDPSVEIWNQPVAGYASEIISERSSAAGGRDLLIHTRLDYVVATQPAFGKQGSQFNSKDLYYYLEVDRDGKVTGGRWKYAGLASGRRTEFIDMMWRSSRVPFQKEFKALNYLYYPSVKRVNSYSSRSNATPTLVDVGYSPANE